MLVGQGHCPRDVGAAVARGEREAAQGAGAEREPRGEAAAERGIARDGGVDGAKR